MRSPASLPSLTLLLSLLSTTLAATSFDCKLTIPSGDRSKSSQYFDLTTLEGLRSALKETDTPPTKSEAKVTMALCGDDGIGSDDALSEEDQCASNTKVCLTLLNHKPSSAEADRVVAVIPVWPGDLSSDKVQISALESGEGLEIYVTGAEYAGTQQELSLKILCSPLSTDDSPTLESYANGLLSLKWSTPAGCPRADEGEDDAVPDSPGDNKKKKGRGFWGLMGLLFWLGFAGLISYFAIGMYYNYTTYGARGKDLLPHRDFWLEFPTMVGDLFSHLLSGLRGRHTGSGGGGGGGSGGSNRGGYTSI